MAPGKVEVQLGHHVTHHVTHYVTFYVTDQVTVALIMRSTLTYNHYRLVALTLQPAT